MNDLSLSDSYHIPFVHPLSLTQHKTMSTTTTTTTSESPMHVARDRLATLTAYLLPSSTAITAAELFQPLRLSSPVAPGSLKGTLTVVDERTGKKYQVEVSPEGSTRKPLFWIRCNLSIPSKTNVITKTEPEPVYTSVQAFAPATVANLGPGFDFLGCAVDGLWDTVSLTVDPHVHPNEISISDISGSNTTKFSKNPLCNCVRIAHPSHKDREGQEAHCTGIATIAAIEAMKITDFACELVSRRSSSHPPVSQRLRG